MGLHAISLLQAEDHTLSLDFLAKLTLPPPCQQTRGHRLVSCGHARPPPPFHFPQQRAHTPDQPEAIKKAGSGPGQLFWQH